MKHPLTKAAQLLASALSVLLLLALVAVGWFYFALRGSLAQLDGSRQLSGLARNVSVTRDAQGVPTVRGSSREDVARALGFLHAQDRFFQMDLLRRRAAGELAGLFGEAALPLDRRTRPHRFRPLAEQVLARLPADQRAVIDAYVAGVNSGLAALTRKPFEYLLLRAEPRSWRAEDSLLIVYAMILDLQDEDNIYELSLMTLRDRFGAGAAAFFAPVITADDAALDGTNAPLPPIPGPHTIDLRKTASDAANREDASRRQRPLAALLEAGGDFLPGSNSVALTGAHTADGAALLGNDPHLSLGVPNIWYRVVTEWPEPGAGGTRRIVGVTIPGLPFAVLGTNGQVAWGMTTAFADTNDLVVVDFTPKAPDLYRVPESDELMQMERHTDTIRVKGGEAETIESLWTVWGPVIGKDAQGRPLAHRWISHAPDATNLEFMRLETANTVEEAIVIVHEAGIPAHNFVVADRAGAIGWTIAGRIPKRIGFDGRMPVSWRYGDRRWEGFLAGKETPAILLGPPVAEGRAASSGDVEPEPRVQSGRLWTANNRLVGGEALRRIGDGGYMVPGRAVQVRDHLAALERATPRDLLALQLDDRALFLARWQQLLLATLTPEAVEAKGSRARLRELVERWQGRATVDSVDYRLVRVFRTIVADRVLEPIFEPCYAQTPQFDWGRFNYEPALWAIVQEKPPHLLPPQFDSWSQLLLAAADQVVDEIERDGTRLSAATWGRHNTARIQHPLGRILPGALGQWLNLPPDPLPGDTHMPRVQNPSFGASLRFAVSPGREEEGLFQMPGGQSGHPLSPFYRAGHETWVRGEPAPLLPGKTVHTLTLEP